MRGKGLKVLNNQQKNKKRKLKINFEKRNKVKRAVLLVLFIFVQPIKKKISFKKKLK